MKCPKCHNPRCKYIEKPDLIEKKSKEGKVITPFNVFERTNFQSICNKCGFEGEIR